MAKKNPSVFGGAMIIGGTIVGAGMFSLPLVMAGSWFLWGMLIILFTWFSMLMSSFMLLEANLNYPVGSSFNTVVKDLLGNKWNLLNGISVAFVLFILTYAYISVSSSVFTMTAKDEFGLILSPKLAGLIFALILALIVWYSTNAVVRAESFILGVKILTFLLTFGVFLFKIKFTYLFNTIESQASYFPYIFVIFPFCLASFGFHNNIPSLIIYFGKDPKRILKAILYGTLIALALYTIWLACTMGNIPRTSFKEIVAKGGDVDLLISTLIGVNINFFTKLTLLIFSNFAVATSFLGVSLGLFDYIADLFKIDNSPLGRFKTALLTFLPPVFCFLLYPNGFLFAIAFAGFATTIWAVIIPALLARKSRIKFPQQLFTTKGKNFMIYLVLIFGAINIITFFLAKFNLLPTF